MGATRRLIGRVLAAHLCLWNGDYAAYRWLLPAKWKHCDDERILVLRAQHGYLVPIMSDLIFANSPVFVRLRKTGEIIRTCYNGGKQIRVPVIAKVLDSVRPADK